MYTAALTLERRESSSAGSLSNQSKGRGDEIAIDVDAFWQMLSNELLVEANVS